MKQQLYVRTDRGSGPPLVLLHGMFADGSQWDKIANLLESDFRVIIVDLLGHGRSPRPPKATYHASEHVEALRNTLESIGAVENATITGYSMGGAVALAYSSMYPADVVQVYLISTPFYLRPEEMLPHQYARSVLLTKATMGLFGSLEKRMHADSRLDGIIKFGNTSSRFHNMIGANDNQLDSGIIRQNLKQLVRSFDFVGYLKKLKVPLTFYAGKKDIFVVQSQLNALRQFCPFMDIQRLDIIKIDHMLVQNLPHEIARLLRKNVEQNLAIPIDKGEGKTLLLIHGIEGSSNYWAPIIPALAKRYRVVALDLLGFGKSPKPLNIGYSLDDQVAWFDRTLQARGIDSCEIMAHSLGGLVALKYASQNPTKVKRLMFFAPVFIPDKASSKKQIIGHLDHIEKLSDGSLLQSHAAQALGYQRLSRYLPFVRTVQHAIRNQHAIREAKLARNIPARFIYGTKDNLIDQAYLAKVSSQFKQSDVIRLDGQGHNIPLFEPSLALQQMLGSDFDTQGVKRNRQLPQSFAKQLVNLAAPILIAKSLLCLLIGGLLFTPFAPWVITIGLAGFVVKLGIENIQGAFSLKNEQLSYFGYIILGLFSILVGYALIQRPELTLKLSILLLSGLVLLTGLVRLIVVMMWTHQPRLRASLLLTGSLMSVAGGLALLGGILSLQFIIYTLAMLLLIRGLQYGIYATIAIFFAYVRGFDY